ncbi:unnamed protein product [Microthlaspi erraticum]|uniref:Uncharacterized protein n=1 Tax=Microthlaspi erraticum TaxID=1685480 RepID=A0A6D2KZI8_9BRAS|nr:unnamed protein product [Microthlaspi erraticum]
MLGCQFKAMFLKPDRRTNRKDLRIMGQHDPTGPLKPSKKTSSPPSDSLVSQLTAIRAIPVDVKTSSSSIKDQVGTAKKDEVKEDLLQIRSGPRSPGSLAARGEIRGGGS